MLRRFLPAARRLVALAIGRMRRPGVRARGVRGVALRGGRLRVVGGFVGVEVGVEAVEGRRV